MNLTHKRLNVFALLFILSSVASSAQSTSFFVNGTYAGDTRYNVKKLFDGSDDNLCWAASASNVIDFWQARYSAYLPEGVPRGQSQLVYSSDVFYSFANTFRDGGGFEEDGLSWWLNGTFLRSFTYEFYDDPLSDGGYYSAFGWDSSDVAKQVGVNESRGTLLGLLSHSLESNYLLTAGIYGGTYGDGAHAISLWGYETDDISGDLLGLWIGDSDSQDAGNVLVGILWNETLNRWDLGGSYESWHLDDITLFAAPAIPEPLYGTFILGGLAAAMLIYRRRRA